jgi:hypothetical protein
MVELLFPPHACISAQRVDVVSNTASARSIFTGATRTVERGGDRFRWSITRGNASDRDGYAERAILKAFLAQARGQASRIWFADPAYVQRGSFPSEEHLANNTFINGTSGWFPLNSSAVLSASDRVLRSTIVESPSTPFFARQVSGLTQYAPYVARAFISPGSGSFTGVCYLGATPGNNEYATTSAALSAMLIAGGVTGSTSPYFGAGALTQNGRIAGDFLTSSFTSLSRCALIDNAVNLLSRSDDLVNEAWIKSRATVSGSDESPDGSPTSSWIIEDSTASNTHEVGQAVTVSSSETDIAFSVALKAGHRTWAQILMTETTGLTTVSAYVNLATGQFGTVSVGANWSGLRTASRDLGSGWFYFSIVARKTNAATSVLAIIRMATGDNGAIYNGDGTSLIRAWRATVKQSSVHSRLSQSTTAPVTSAPQTGAGLYLKGLPPGVNGLLLPGDRVQIGNQLCEVVSPLNSDAAGLGYLQLAWPLRTPPADNAPVIINKPMARCILTSNEGGWSDTPGGFSEFDFQLEEALDE